MKWGNKNIINLQYGSKNIIAAYWGNKKVWENGPLDLTKNYCTIEALENGLTVSFSTNLLLYSIDDGDTWNELPADTSTPSINVGEKILFKQTGLIPLPNWGIGTFTVNKNFNLKGNVMSLLFGDERLNRYNLSGYDYAFTRLFMNCTTLQSVSKDFLPATTLAESCYYEMFYGCSSLVNAPALPATTLVDSCYSYMFQGCSKLNYIKALFTTEPGSDTSNWVNEVSSTGTFVKNKNATWNVTGINGVPEGWDIQTI